ncbi:hypothetical protein HC891_25990 [Candidatus Gracilibacteria bacterium]|nr:hypothetical protein [Candidatus Gracilibacteria bacterium]
MIAHTTRVHPLAATLARVTATNTYLSTQYGEPTEADWYRPAALYTASSAALAAQIAKAHERLRTTTPIVVAGSLLQGYQWPLIHAAVACYLADRRVPEVQPDDVWLHHKHGAEHADEIDALALTSTRFYTLPDDPDAATPTRRSCPTGSPAQRPARYDRRSLRPAVALLCAELGCKERALWLFVADGLAGTMAWLLQEQQPALSLAQLDVELAGLVRVPNSPLYTTQIGLFTLTYREQLHVQYDRATCCYWYKTADANGDCCTTCPKRPTAERDALLLKDIAEQYKARLQGEAVAHGNAHMHERPMTRGTRSPVRTVRVSRCEPPAGWNAVFQS